MTSRTAIQKEVEKLRQHVALKPEDVITPYMWRPNGEDKLFKPGDRVRIKHWNGVSTHDEPSNREEGT